MEKRRKCALSTSDNKFNPITDFNRWFAEDRRLRHNVCGILAENAPISSAFPDQMIDDIVEKVIDYMVERNELGRETNYEVNYIKVVG